MTAAGLLLDAAIVLVLAGLFVLPALDVIATIRAPRPHRPPYRTKRPPVRPVCEDPQERWARNARWVRSHPGQP